MGGRIGHVNSFQDDGALTAARWLGNLEAERLAGSLGFLDQLHPLDLLELAHSLGGLRGDLAEAVIELAQGGDLLLLVLVGGILPLVASITFLKKGGVVARVGMQASVGDLVDGLNDLVHELAVVRNQEHGAGVGLEIVLEPEERDKVEVVGRFVEQEEVGLHHEQTGEVGAHDPSTAQFLGFPLEVLLLVTESDEDLLRLGLDLGIAQGGVLSGGFAVLGGVDGAGLLEFVEPLLQCGNFSSPPGGDIKDGLLAGGLTLLGEVADHGPLVALDAS